MCNTRPMCAFRFGALRSALTAGGRTRRWAPCTAERNITKLNRFKRSIISFHEENDAHLDVDEGVLAAMDLESVERLVDQVAHILPLLLAIVDSVSEVHYTKGIERTIH